jgi:serine/threonine-protein kinase
MTDTIKTKTAQRLRAKSTCWLTMPQHDVAPRLVPGAVDVPDDQSLPVAKQFIAETTAATDAADGTISRLNEEYEVLGVAGESPVCRVYKVRNEQLGSVMALKLLKDEFATSDAANRQFQREISAAVTLCHPNIVPVYGHGRLDNGAVFVVEKLCDGARNLSQIVRDDGPLESARAANLFVQIADAMAHAHSKAVVHGDLKPSNIVVQSGQTDEEETASVIDFGIATVLQSARSAVSDVKSTGEIFGTPEYMSPEQCLGEPLDQRSDIYSFGCLMYETLVGRAPFRGINPVQIIMQHLTGAFPGFDDALRQRPLAADLEMIIKKCLEKDAAMRYQSFDELKSALEQLRTGDRRAPVAYYTYATLGQRLNASLLDGLIICVLCAFFIPGLSALVRALGQHMPYGETLNQLISPIIFTPWPAAWTAFTAGRIFCNDLFANPPAGMICLVVLLFLYFGAFECSPLRATPGKLWAGLQVQSRNGEGITFFSFVKRMLAKAITFQSALLCSFFFNGRSSLADTWLYPPSDEFSGTFVVQKCKTPDRIRPNRFIRPQDTKMAEAHRFRKRALAILALQVVCFLFAQLGSSDLMQGVTGCIWLLAWMAPSAIVALTFHARCKQLSQSSASWSSPSWTTLFMRSLNRGKRQS